MSSLTARYLLVFASTTCVFLLFQNQGTYLPDADAYFHITIAREILQHGFVASLPSMACSIHADRYVDFHFLYHYALVPFLFIFQDGILASKIATSVFSGWSTLSLYRLLLNARVKYVWFWILFFMFASPLFLGRLMFGRGVTIFLSLLFLFIDAMRRKKYKPAAAYATLSVWTYPGFPVAILFTILFAILEIRPLARNRGKSRFRRSLKTLLWPSVGFLVGLIVHPAFPHQFYGYYLEFVVHSLHPEDLEKIAEWHSLGPSLSFLGFILPFSVLVVSFISFPYSKRELVRRFSPFQVTCLLLFLLLSISTLVATKPFEYVMPILIPFLGIACSGSLTQHWGKLAAPFIILSILVWSIPQSLDRMKLQFRLNNPVHKLATTDALAKLSSKDALVFLPWDDYPLFLFKETSLRFLYGLNPVYCYGADASKYKEIRSFMEGNPGMTQVAQDWNASYAVLKKSTQGRAIQQILSEGQTVAYENPEYFLFEINYDLDDDSKGIQKLQK